MEQLEEQSVAPAAAVVEYAIRIANASKLNLADFQNSVPLLRELAIVNDSESGLSHLQLRLESWPAADSDDTALSFSSFFKLYRTDIPQRRMTARRIIEALDVIEHV